MRLLGKKPHTLCSYFLGPCAEVYRSRVFLLFRIQQKDAAYLGNQHFLHMLFLKKPKQQIAKKAGHCLIHLKIHTHTKFEAVLAMFNFSQKLLVPYFSSNSFNPKQKIATLSFENAKYMTVYNL